MSWEHAHPITIQMNITFIFYYGCLCCIGLLTWTSHEQPLDLFIYLFMIVVVVFQLNWNWNWDEMKEKKKKKKKEGAMRIMAFCVWRVPFEFLFFFQTLQFWGVILASKCQRFWPQISSCLPFSHSIKISI